MRVSNARARPESTSRVPSEFDSIASRVRASARESSVVVLVSDTGIGIKAEALGKLFRPFSQVDTGLSRSHEGTGLGLSVCKRLVERLGGSIWVESEWSHGSTFGFELPIESKPE